MVWKFIGVIIKEDKIIRESFFWVIRYDDKMDLEIKILWWFDNM